MFRKPSSNFKYKLSSPARSLSLVSDYDSFDEDLDFRKSCPRCFIVGGSRFTNMRFDASFFEYSRSGLAPFIERTDNIFRKEERSFRGKAKFITQKSSKDDSHKLGFDSVRFGVLKDNKKYSRCQRYMENQPCSSNCSQLHALPKDEGVVCKYFYFYLQCDERCCVYSHTERCSEEIKKAYFDKWHADRCQNLLRRSQCLGSCNKIHRYPREDGVYCLEELVSSCDKGLSCRYLHKSNSVNERVAFRNVDEPSRSKKKFSEYFLPEHGAGEINVSTTEHGFPQKYFVNKVHSSSSVIYEHLKNKKKFSEKFPDYVHDLNTQTSSEAELEDDGKELSSGQESSEEEELLLSSGIGSIMGILKGFRQSVNGQNKSKHTVIQDVRIKSENSDKITTYATQTSSHLCRESKVNKPEHHQKCKNRSKSLSLSVLRCNAMENYYHAYENDYYETSRVGQSRNEALSKDDINLSCNSNKSAKESEFEPMIPCKRQEYKLRVISDTDRQCIGGNGINNETIPPATFEALEKLNMVQDSIDATLKASENQENLRESSDTYLSKDLNKAESHDVQILNIGDIKDQVGSQSSEYPEYLFSLSPQNLRTSLNVNSSCIEDESAFNDDENEITEKYSICSLSPTELNNAAEVNVEDYIILDNNDSRSDYESPHDEGEAQQKKLPKTLERESQNIQNMTLDTKESSSNNKNANKSTENFKDSSIIERPSIIDIKSKTSDVDIGSEYISQETNPLHLVSHSSEYSIDIKQDDNYLRKYINPCPNINNPHNTDLNSSQLMKTFQGELSDHNLREIKLGNPPHLVLSSKEIKAEILKVEADEQDCIIINDSDAENEHISVEERQESVANWVKRVADNFNNLYTHTPPSNIDINLTNQALVAQRENTQLKDELLRVNDKNIIDGGERKKDVIVTSYANLEKNVNESSTFFQDAFLCNYPDQNSSNVSLDARTTFTNIREKEKAGICEVIDIDFAEGKMHYNNDNHAVEREGMLRETPENIQQVTNKSSSVSSHTDATLNRENIIRSGMAMNSSHVENIKRNELDIAKITKSCVKISCSNLKKELNNENGIDLVDSDLSLSYTNEISRNIFQNENEHQQPLTISPSLQVLNQERDTADEILPLAEINGIHEPLHNSIILPPDLIEGIQDKEKKHRVLQRDLPQTFKYFPILQMKDEVLEPEFIIVASDDEDVIIISDDDNVSESADPSCIKKDLTQAIPGSTEYRFDAVNLCKDMLLNTVQEKDTERTILVPQNLQINSANLSEIARDNLHNILDNSEHVTNFMNIDGNLRTSITNESNDSSKVNLSANLRTSIPHVSLPQTSQLFQNTADMKRGGKNNSYNNDRVYTESGRKINSLEHDSLTKLFCQNNIETLNASFSSIIRQGDEGKINLLQEFLMGLQDGKVSDVSNLCIQNPEYKNSSIAHQDIISSEEILSEPNPSMQNLATTLLIQNDNASRVKGLFSNDAILCKLKENGVIEKGSSDEKSRDQVTENTLKSTTNTLVFPNSLEITRFCAIDLKGDMEFEGMANHTASAKTVQVQEITQNARLIKETSSEDLRTLESDAKPARRSSQQSSDKLHAMTFDADSLGRHNTTRNMTETTDYGSENINIEGRSVIDADLNLCSNEERSYEGLEKSSEISVGADTKVQNAQYSLQYVDLQHTKTSHIKTMQNAEDELAILDKRELLHCGRGAAENIVFSKEKNSIADTGLKCGKKARERSSSPSVVGISSKDNSITNKERRATVKQKDLKKSTLFLCEDDVSGPLVMSGLFDYKCDGDDSGKVRKGGKANNSSKNSTKIVKKINLKVNNNKCMKIVSPLSSDGKGKNFKKTITVSLVADINDKNLHHIDPSDKSSVMSDSSPKMSTTCRDNSHRRSFSSSSYRVTSKSDSKGSRSLRSKNSGHSSSSLQKPLTEETIKKSENEVDSKNSSKSKKRTRSCSVILDKIYNKKAKMKTEILSSTKTFALRSKSRIAKDSQEPNKNRSTSRTTKMDTLKAETEFSDSENDGTQKECRKGNRSPDVTQAKLPKRSVSGRKKDKSFVFNLRDREKRSKEKRKKLDADMSLAETDERKGNDTHLNIKSRKGDLKKKKTLKEKRSNFSPKEKRETSKSLDFDSENFDKYLDQIIEGQTGPVLEVPSQPEDAQCKSAGKIPVTEVWENRPQTRSRSARIKKICVSTGKNLGSNNNCNTCKETESVNKVSQQTKSRKRGSKTNKSQKRKMDSTTNNIVITKTPRKDGSIRLQF